MVKNVGTRHTPPSRCFLLDALDRPRNVLVQAVDNHRWTERDVPERVAVLAGFSVLPLPILCSVLER